MTLQAPNLTYTEQEDPDPSSKDTLADRSWSDFVRNFWRGYDVGGSVYEPGSRESRNLPSAGGTHPTTIEVRDEAPVVEFPQRVRPLVDQLPSFHPLQEWEGYVLEVGEDTFTARLTDITAEETTANEEVELPIDDLTDDDKRLLEPGRVFRWAIGYLRAVSGSKKRISQIVFRRLPQWTQKELVQAEEEAKQISAALKSE